MRVASAYDASIMKMDAVQPTDPEQRLDLLDGLRGFALAGVLLANLVAFCLYAFLPSAHMTALPTANIDRLLDPALSALVSGKFFTLFSLMFGVGFSLQMQRASDDPVRRQRYLRRLGALLVIGMLHATLLWWGDVLRYYAVLGLLLLPLHRWPAGRLVAIGTVLVVLQPLLALVLPSFPVATQDQAHAAALVAFSSHEWSTMLQGNRAFADWWLTAHWGTLMSIAGCMLVGAALGRSGVLRDPVAHARFWKRLLLALPTGLTLALVLLLSDYGRLPWPDGWQDTGGVHVVLWMLNRAVGLILGLGYMAAFVLLFGMHRWRRLLQPLAPVGRMALSNYLAHSVVGIGLFYGIGLGLGPRYGLVGVGVVWVAVFATQIVLSHWWLARFRFGPAEWLWRSVTYGRRQPMRR